MSKEETLQRLRPYIPRFHQIVHQAYSRAQERFGPMAAELGSYPFAVVVNRLMLSAAEREFFDDKDVTVRRDNKGHGGGIVIRSKEEDWEIHVILKKLSETWLVWNAPSDRRKRWFGQMVIFDFMKEETSDRTNVVVGYRVLQLGTSIDVWVTCPIGRRQNAWIHCIDDEVQAHDDTPEQGTTVPPTIPVPSERKERFVPNKQQEPTTHHEKKAQ